MVIENRPFGVRTSVIIGAKTLRCQNISKLIYFDGKTDLTQTREKITRVRGNQAGISACLITQLGLVSIRLALHRQDNPMGIFSYPMSYDRPMVVANPSICGVLLYSNMAILSR
jgi:hypothetical protein